MTPESFTDNAILILSFSEIIAYRCSGTISTPFLFNGFVTNHIIREMIAHSLFHCRRQAAKIHSEKTLSK